MKALRRAILFAVTSNVAAAQSQSPIVVGTLRTAEGGLAIPYGGVIVRSLDRELLTNDQGMFTLRGLPSGPLDIRFRKVGFTPRDTTVQLTAGDTLRLDITLARVVISLDSMRVRGSKTLRLAAGCPLPSNAAENSTLIDLLEQVVQNAEQYRLLVNTNPFSLKFSQVALVRNLDGSVVHKPKTMPGPEPTDHFVVKASAKPVYQPGRVFRSTGGVEEVFVPELQDLAAQDFIARHCFSYGGDTTLDSTRFVRVAFTPVGELSDDIEGTITLHADGYSISTIEMRTTGVPSRFTKRFASVRVVTEFRDLRPGIAVLSRLESFIAPGTDDLKREPGVASRGEIQTLVGVLWTKAPP